MKVTAVVPAAGAGRRMKKGKRKPFLILGDKPILIHTLSRLEDSPYIDEIIVVVDKEDMDKSRRLIRDFGLDKVTSIVSGGKSRFESVRRGLACVDKKTDLVFIHDGVRPFVSVSVISATIKKAAASGGAIAAVPVASTIKFVKTDGRVDYTPQRSRLWVAGTPQVFRREFILKAYKESKSARDGKVFDDSTLVERLGVRVDVVLDSYDNIKITTPLDLAVGEAILNRASQNSFFVNQKSNCKMQNDNSKCKNRQKLEKIPSFLKTMFIFISLILNFNLSF